VVTFLERLAQRVRRHEPAKRQPAADRLRERDDPGLDVPVLMCEHLAGPAQAENTSSWISVIRCLRQISPTFGQ